MSWRPVIGLEVHVQLATRTKLFSACPRAADARQPANRYTDPVSLGLPGTLPVLNRNAVELAVRLGVALEGRVARRSRFVRKHYFYPDLPRNFQITQESEPLVRGGRVRFELDGEVRELPIIRMHLEEDAARTVHGEGRIRVDFNRAGAALVEIVTEPGLREPREAAAVLTSLRELVRWIGVSDADLEEGQLRCDANVSLQDEAAGSSGARVELKNLNSIRGVARALQAEIQRQRSVLESGAVLDAQTRGWDAVRLESFAQRSKESIVDYRFLEEPDLGDLVVEEPMLSAARRRVGELPIDARTRWRRAGMDDGAARVLSADVQRAAWCDALLDAGAPAGELGRWARTDLLHRARERGGDLADLPWTVAALADLMQDVASGRRTDAGARQLLDAAPGRDLERVLAEHPAGAVRVPDEAELEAFLARYPGQVADYRSGKLGLLGWLVARFRETHPGLDDPAAIARELRRLLSRDPP